MNALNQHCDIAAAFNSNLQDTADNENLLVNRAVTHQFICNNHIIIGSQPQLKTKDMR